MYIIDRKIILFLIMIIYVSQLKDFSNTLKIMGWKPGKLNRESFRCRESCLIFKTCIPIEDKSWHESANFDDIYRLISWNRIGERMFSCWKNFEKIFAFMTSATFIGAHRPSISYANSLERWISFCLVSLVRPRARLYLFWKFKIAILKEISENI